MKEHFDIIFVTNQPSFYKVRLWNEIAKQRKVLLIFLERMEEDRNKDFVSEKPEFEYVVLPGDKWAGLRYLVLLLKKTDYDRLVIGGWDHPCLLFLPFISPKSKNAMLCESSFYEYQPNVLKDFIKRIFLMRIAIAFPSGKAQERIFEHFDFRGTIRQTGGCGLLNYVAQPIYQPRSEVCRFLYVGRLVKPKNLHMLIQVFNEFPNLELNIIGFGELEGELRKNAGENVHFLGAVDNKQLSVYYQTYDVFVLPSTFEPWGLVVEEALNNGMPVIVSDKVGCWEDLVTPEYGLVFDSTNVNDLKRSIQKMTNIAFYNRLRRNIAHLDFHLRAKRQVEVFLQ